MIFKRTYRLSSSKSLDEIKKSLVGNKVDVHQLSFEIIDKENMLKIIPHAEHDEKLRILPITHLVISGSGNNTKVKMSSKPRRTDVGGPNLLVIFCIFIFVAALWMFLAKRDQMFFASIVLGSIGLLVFVIFWIKMEAGYFDYVRKLRDFVKSNL